MDPLPGSFVLPKASRHPKTVGVISIVTQSKKTDSKIGSEVLGSDPVSQIKNHVVHFSLFLDLLVFLCSHIFVAVVHKNLHQLLRHNHKVHD